MNGGIIPTILGNAVQFSHSVVSDSLQPHGLQACQASPSITNSQSLLKFMSIESYDAIQPSHPLSSWERARISRSWAITRFWVFDGWPQNCDGTGGCVSLFSSCVLMSVYWGSKVCWKSVWHLGPVCSNQFMSCSLGYVILLKSVRSLFPPVLGWGGTSKGDWEGIASEVFWKTTEECVSRKE